MKRLEIIKHIERLILIIKNFFTGYRRESLEVFSASNDTKKRILFFTKKSKDKEDEFLFKLFVDNYLLCKNEHLVDIIDISDNEILVVSRPFQERLTLEIFRISSKTRVKSFVTDSLSGFKTVGDNYLIFRDTYGDIETVPSNEFVIINRQGEEVYSGISNYSLFRFNDGKEDGIVLKSNGKYYVCSIDFKYKKSFDYIRSFWNYRIGIEDNKQYIISCKEDLVRNEGYKEVTENVILGCIEKDIHIIFVVKNDKDMYNVLDENKNDIFQEDFMKVYPISKEILHPTFAQMKDGRIVILNFGARPKVIDTSIKNVNFLFRNVFYGQFYETFAGVSVYDMDEDVFIDADGKYHTVYNSKEYKLFEEEYNK